ncbi:glucose-1-phosphate adenylyltransferase [Aquiluna borgnonia]|uniref:Glucose-1-phosphate adenylyltransferase n=1 Tax=Aquiluna borgnonia TaxID=2499157 RepID=A0A7D4TJ35_9MICO|nr:glucose-1-phosphate adenylyltransferase [Aquiluna borgnonia]QKJ25331.1 glucose-1-phosphate adenylyltransferase [Aquiluna borgnonia]
MGRTRVFGMVLAGGEGKRLMPLTADRAKPAVPFAGSYRLVDFALSNLINSGLRRIVVLTQYKSHSLDRHVSQTWRMSPLLGGYVASVPAQQRLGKRWYTGSADAILQSMNALSDERPDYVVVVGADHVYRMDFDQMLQSHIDSGMEATVAAIRQPISLATQFGVIEVDDGNPTQISAFREKPSDPHPVPGDPTQALVSMGNYIFNAQSLIEAIELDGENADSSHDMGGDIIPYFVAKGSAGAYDFTFNEIPGATARDKSYWRDVGTIDSYYDAHMDLISTMPIFNLYNSDWPVYNQQINLPPAKFIHDSEGNQGRTQDSIVSLGVVVSGGVVDRSVLSPNVRVSSRSLITDSVLLDDVQIGRDCTIRRAILDKNVVVSDGASIGVNKERDLERGFTVTDSGITVVAKGLLVKP